MVIPAAWMRLSSAWSSRSWLLAAPTTICATVCFSDVTMRKYVCVCVFAYE
jgi:multisubunit Na+/H+ antiporter MnhE subunit